MRSPLSMRLPRSVRFLSVAAMLGLTVIGAVAFVAYSGRLDAPGPVMGAREGSPRAAARRLDRLGQTIPGNEGESPDGPGGRDAQHFAALAYPADDVRLDWLAAARESFGELRARGVGAGKTAPDQWFHMGPTSAVYQSTPLRFSYVPSQVRVVWPRDGDGDCAHLRPRQLPDLGRGGGRWRLAHGKRAGR